jgi:anti-sigma B factor antagonist
VEKIQVSSDQGDVIFFAPSRITLVEGAITLRETVRSLVEGGFPNITLDMAGTTYIDSAGIGELVAGFTYSRNKGGTLRLNRLKGNPRDLLEITKLRSVFESTERDLDALPKVTVSSGDLSPLRAAKSLPLLLTLREKRIDVELGIADGLFKVTADTADGESSQIVLATPHVRSGGAHTLLRDQLQEFQDLINSESSREEDIHGFLEKNPTFLLGEGYRELHSKVLLEREGSGPLIPDFILQPFDQELCDLLELKLPSEPLIVGTENRRRFSGAVHAAIAQLRTYRDYFDDRKNRERISSRYGVKVYRPRMSVVIGRLPTLDPLEYRQIVDGQRDVQIVTYDDLLARAKRFLVV